MCDTCSGASKAEDHTAEVIGALEATEEKEGYTGDSICSICKYEISKGEVIPVITQEPTETEPTAPATQPEKKGNNGAVVAAAIVLVLGAGGGGVVLFVKKPWKK